MKKNTFLIIALTFAVTAFAQISVSGVVANDSIPLESANVIVKNSTNGIATNQKGEFKLSNDQVKKIAELINSNEINKLVNSIVKIKKSGVDFRGYL